MGLLEIVGNVLTRYKADVSDHVKGLEKLKGAEKERAKAAIETGNQVESSLEDQIKTLAKVGVAVGAIYAAGKVAIDSYKFSLEASRLETGAQHASLEGLRRASAGLKSDVDLLRDAVKFKSAAFKMSQKDMEDAEGAMRSYVRQGKNAEKVNEAITQALTKLSTEGLQELGVNIDKAGLSMDDAADRGELFKRVMSALRKESAGVADAQLSVEERMAASGVQFENAVDQMKRSLGQLVVALAPLVAKVAELVANIAKIPGAVRTGARHSADMTKKGVNAAAEFLGFESPYIDEDEWNNEDHWNKMGADARRYARAQQLYAQGKSVAANALLAGGTEDGSGGELMNALAGLAGGLVNKLPENTNAATPVGADYKGKGERDKNAAKAAALAQKYQDSQRDAFFEQIKNQLGDLMRESQKAYNELEAEAELERQGLEAWAETRNSIFEDLEAGWERVKEQSTRDERYSQFVKERSKSRLEEMFGPIDEFNAYQTAFNGLTGAMGAALGAWIEGTQSAGAAAKAFLAQLGKSLAVEFLMQAAKHGAYAIGDLAFGNFPGAALHAKAAAAFLGASALVAGVTHEAYQAGWGGGGSSAGGAASSPATLGGSGGVGRAANDNRGQPIVMIIGDPYDLETNQLRRDRSARRAVERYMPTAAGGAY